jgi:hypothetical protein
MRMETVTGFQSTQRVAPTLNPVISKTKNGGGESMSLILGIIFGGVLLFIISSWMRVKNPVVTPFWERVEEHGYQPKRVNEINVRIA